jgi:hypothetical protein
MPQHEQLRNTLPHQPHDKYARYVLQISRIAADLIRLTLPPGLLEEIDLDTLASGKESYVDSQMTQHFFEVLRAGRNPYIIPEVFKEICSFVLNNTLPDVELSFYRVSTLYFTKISPDFITKFFADMENENETVVEQYINAVFTPENLPMMLKRIENIEVFRKQGIEEGKAEGIELTIGTFLLKVPDMPDDEVANLFDVTPGYIRKLREKLKKG